MTHRRWSLTLIVLVLCSFIGVGLALSSQVQPAPSEQQIEGEMEQATDEASHGSQGWDLAKRTMVFLAVAIVLVILLKKPLSQALSNRTKSIKEDLENLEVRKKEAEAALDEVLARLKHVQDEKDKVVAQFMTQGEEEKAKILAEAEELAVRIREQARASIEQEVDKAKTELQREVAEKAADKALELIKANITPEDRDRLVDEYIKQVVR